MTFFAEPIVGNMDSFVRMRLLEQEYSDKRRENPPHMDSIIDDLAQAQRFAQREVFAAKKSA